MEILKNQKLGSLTTMKLGGTAKYLCTIINEQDVLKAVNFAKKNNLEIITIGTGSNIIFTDTIFDGLVIVNEVMGISFKKNGLVSIGSGENWDKIVKLAVEKQLVGIEALSLIPGTAGGAPVNNIGAYGQEIKDTLLYVRAYDTVLEKFVRLENKDCEFTYRNSLFKTKAHSRYIICNISLKLSPLSDKYQPPSYPSLQNELLDSPINVRKAVIKIRSAKLPNPNIMPNTGSFFKNPIIENSVAKKLLVKYPQMPAYPAGNKTKIPAGWLIENAGLKGTKKEGLWIYDKQALVIVNESATNFFSLQALIDYITKTIYEKYGLRLEIEPEIIK